MKINLKCRILMAAYYSLNCVLLSYVTYYLGSIGFSDLFISAVVGGACGIGSVLQIFAGRVADRNVRWNWRKFLIVFGFCELGLGISRVLIPFTGWQCLSYALMIVFLILMMPMVNQASFYYSSRGVSVNFGVARGIGSAVYAAVSFGIGKLTGMLGSGCIPAVTAVLAVVLLAAAIAMPELALPENAETKETNACQSEKSQPKLDFRDFLKKYPVFLNMVAGLALLLIFHNMINTFLIRLMESVGGDSRSLGIALAVAAVSEIPILFLYSRISSSGKITTGMLLFISCACYVVRGFLYITASSVFMIYLIQLLQSVSFGLMIAAKATYADESMAPEDKTTGQSFMSFTDSFGSVAGTLLGGLLISLGGLGLMLRIGVFIAAAGTALVFLAAMRKKRAS